MKKTTDELVKTLLFYFVLILEDSSGNTQVKESQAGNPSLAMDTS